MSMTLEELAMNANMAINIKNDKLASDSLSALYNTVQRNSRLLLNLPSSSCQVVGLAFTGMALIYNWGDEDINSVASENAYYCLAKGYKDTNNTFCLPAIFTTLQRRPYLLQDKFTAYWSDKAQKEIGMPIGIALGGNPFRSPHLTDFREQALSHKVYVQQYVLSKFFDETNMQFTIPTDLPYYLPKISDIEAFFKVRSEFPDINDNGKCKEIFDTIFKECEHSLIQCS